MNEILDELETLAKELEHAYRRDINGNSRYVVSTLYFEMRGILFAVESLGLKLKGHEKFKRACEQAWDFLMTGNPKPKGKIKREAI